MSERKGKGIVVGEHPLELFRDLVAGALSHRKPRVQEEPSELSPSSETWSVTPTRGGASEA